MTERITHAQWSADYKPTTATPFEVSGGELKVVTDAALDALKRGASSSVRVWRNPDEPNGDVALYTAQPSIDALIAERQALLDALKEVAPYVNRNTVSCRGDKCRKRWCYSCFSEEVVEEAIIKMEQAFENAQQAIALCEDKS